MLTVVVPTYKEAANIPVLVARLDRVLAGKAIEYELIVVDDLSPDDTVTVCADLSERYPLRLVRAAGRPRDLSLSVVDGIQLARYDRVLVMDADLSHPPEAIPAMMRELDHEPAAFVIGSRYVMGGSFDRQWSWWRVVNSYAATLLARPLVRCSDPMSGFFMFHRSVLGDPGSLNPIGYKIGLELMVRGGFSTVREIPIAFADREIGASKMNLGQQVKYLRHLRRLYLARFGGVAEFFHFGAVGASGFVIDVLFYYGLQLMGLDHLTSRALSFCPAVSWNWALNRTTTFGERVRRPKARQWLEFVMTSGIGFSINMGVYYYLTTGVHFFDRYKLLGLIVGIISASLFNFTLSTLFVYNERRQ